jgi:hypothetical protein
VGESVGTATLDALLKPECRAKLGESRELLPIGICDVAYFDQFERSVGVTDLLRRSIRRSRAPICACFGSPAKRSKTRSARKVLVQVRGAVERAKSDEARCSQTAANGRSCVAEIQRYYLKCRARKS